MSRIPWIQFISGPDKSNLAKEKERNRKEQIKGTV
jgi:hypothetical protein